MLHFKAFKSCIKEKCLFETVDCVPSQIILWTYCSLQRLFLAIETLLRHCLECAVAFWKRYLFFLLFASFFPFSFFSVGYLDIQYLCLVERDLVKISSVLLLTLLTQESAACIASYFSHKPQL